MNFKNITLFLCLLFIPTGVLGAGAGFLKMAVGAKPAAMGGAYTALADDVTSIYWNPAGLAQVNQPEFNFMHNEWLYGINYEFLGASFPVDNLTFASSLTYLSTDDIKEILRDTEGMGNGRYWETGKVFSAEDMALSLAFAQAVEKDLFMGVNFKYISESIENESTSGWAIDLGLLFKPSQKVGVGFVVQNVGPKMKFIEDEFSLPLTYRLGVAYQMGKLMRCAFDIKKVKDEKLDSYVGLESWLGNWLALRVSQGTKSDDKLGKFKGLPTGIAVGCGLNISQSVVLDYAYLPYGDLGETHQFSISMKFGSKRESRPKIKPHKVYKPIERETKPTKSREKDELTVYVTMDNVDIWAGPGTNYSSITQVAKGTKLLVLDASKKWYYKVMLDDGTIGWICSTFVKW